MAKPKILIADDEPFNVDYLAQELDEDDCEILTAADGGQALEAVRSQAPDLVLLDIMMPVLDGFGVLARLKADPATRAIPVIIISAASDLQSVVRGIQLGAEDYLPKPFEPVLLHARVGSALEKKRLHDLQQVYLKSLEREFEIAREIQRSFLPDALPSLPGWQVAASLRAAKEVAGDFYDAFILPDGSLACVLGDVCGKGVGAALFMTLFRSLVRAGALSDIGRDTGVWAAASPGERLGQLVAYTNRYVAGTHESAGMFTTLFIGYLAPATGVLTYANCGSEPPLVVRGGQVAAELAATGPVVGILPEAVYAVQELTLLPGDTLLAYTDGVSDALNAAGRNYGAERLCLALGAAEDSAEGLLAAVTEDVCAFSGAAAQFDDVTMLALRRER
ncbi:MAG: PP2C family protein-serine/threonine phosphatase [Anaerolineae bacterium]